MPNTNVTPYLFFGGRCDEALDFYRQSVGATLLMRMRFDESPEPLPPGMIPPGFSSKVMHASMRIGNTTVMASDGCGEGPRPAGFSLAVSVDTAGEATRMFDALADGGTVGMPLERTFWSPLYGTVTDRFGVSWMVMVAASPQ